LGNGTVPLCKSDEAQSYQTIAKPLWLWTRPRPPTATTRKPVTWIDACAYEYSLNSRPHCVTKQSYKWAR